MAHVSNPILTISSFLRGNEPMKLNRFLIAVILIIVIAEI
jgi:hypothetical protein